MITEAGAAPQELNCLFMNGCSIKLVNSSTCRARARPAPLKGRVSKRRKWSQRRNKRRKTTKKQKKRQFKSK